MCLISLKFLEHFIISEDIALVNIKTKAIKEIATSQNEKELQRFLGIVCQNLYPAYQSSKASQ